VPDTNGEYFEVQTLGPRPLALKGLSLQNSAATVTLACNLMLLPGRPLLLQADANGGRNGGLPLGVPLPFQSIALGDVSDVLSLARGPTTIDQVTYASGFPGGLAVAAEKRNLIGATTSGNFGAPTQVFGAGDRGTPGQRNQLDATPYPVLVDVESTPGAVLLRGTALAHGGRFSGLVMAFGTVPGFDLFGAHVPLNFDPLLQLFLAFPGTIAALPEPGYRSLRIPLPQPNPLAGVQVHALHAILDLSNLTIPGLSAPQAVVLQ